MSACSTYLPVEGVPVGDLAVGARGEQLRLVGVVGDLGEIGARE